MLLNTWPYYYVEIARENIRWKYSLVCILAIFSIVFLLLVAIKGVQYFLSKYGKSKFRMVEILAVNDFARIEEGAYKLINGKSKVIIRDYNKKRGRKHAMLMDSKGIKEGDVGLLEYKGEKGISFSKQESLIDDQKSIYYKFGFKKESESESLNKNRKKRKYW